MTPSKGPRVPWKNHQNSLKESSVTDSVNWCKQSVPQGPPCDCAKLPNTERGDRRTMWRSPEICVHIVQWMQTRVWGLCDLTSRLAVVSTAAEHELWSDHMTTDSAILRCNRSERACCLTIRDPCRPNSESANEAMSLRSEQIQIDDSESQRHSESAHRLVTRVRFTWVLDPWKWQSSGQQRWLESLCHTRANCNFKASNEFRICTGHSTRSTRRVAHATSSEYPIKLMGPTRLDRRHTTRARAASPGRCHLWKVLCSKCFTS